MLKTGGASAGALHLVEFAEPGAPVRQDVRVFDQLPKNLDIYVRDMAARFEELKARGLKFRSDPNLTWIHAKVLSSRLRFWHQRTALNAFLR